MFSQSSTMREVFEYPEPSTMRRQENGEGYEPKQQGFIVYKEKNKKDKKDKEKDRVFFQIKVIGQVASFVQKLKSSAILRKPNF